MVASIYYAVKIDNNNVGSKTTQVFKIDDLL